MKMDEKYFQMKSADVILLSQKYLVSGNPDEWATKLDDCLKQIARDAADEQRINCSAACALRMKGRVDANCKCGEIYCTAKLEIPYA
jgi:hypothetical protein